MTSVGAAVMFVATSSVVGDSLVAATVGTDKEPWWLSFSSENDGAVVLVGNKVENGGVVGNGVEFAGERRVGRLVGSLVGLADGFLVGYLVGEYV